MDVAVADLVGGTATGLSILKSRKINLQKNPLMFHGPEAGVLTAVSTVFRKHDHIWRLFPKIGVPPNHSF